jgi:hypothetical protein
MLTDFLDQIEAEPFFLGKMIEKDGKFDISDDGRFKVHANETIHRRIGAI